jgi:glycosyltransferase involved in cell wall biosynthesis
MTRRVGVVGTVVYPASLDATAGDVKTWSAVGEYFDQVTVIAQTPGFRPRRRRVGNVDYILLPRLPRALDILAFPLGATLTGVVLYGCGVRTWAFSDPLRSGLVSLALGCLPGVNVVVHLQGQLLKMPSNRFGRRTGIVEALSRVVARRADIVRAVSQQIAREAEAAGVAPGRIVVVPNRCDTEFFDPDRWAEAGKALRASLPGDHASPVVGFLGSFNRSKGVDVLIDALSQVAQHRPVRLAVAGDGPLREEFEDAAAHGVAPIALLGRLPASDVPRFLAAVDVLALPSYDEGLPRVVLEAMAMRVPVVASDVGGIPEAVDDATSGLLVPAGHAEALAAALERVLADSSLAYRLGEAGRRRVVEEFDARAGWRRLAAVHGSEARLRG